MKRKSLFLFALIVALLSLTNVHVSAEPVLVNLEVGFIDPTDDQEGLHLGNVLKFIVDCLDDGPLSEQQFV